MANWGTIGSFTQGLGQGIAMKNAWEQGERLQDEHNWQKADQERKGAIQDAYKQADLISQGTDKTAAAQQIAAERANSNASPIRKLTNSLGITGATDPSLGRQATDALGITDAAPAPAAAPAAPSGPLGKGIAAAGGVGLPAASSAPAAAPKEGGDPDEYMNRWKEYGMPMIQQAYLRAGMPEQASKLGDFVEKENVKTGMRHWSRARMDYERGDMNGMAQNFMKAYKAYNPKDGHELVNINVRKGKDGAPVGVDLEFRNSRTGDTSKRSINGMSDFHKFGMQFLSPEAQIIYGQKSLEDSEKTAADLAKTRMTANAALQRTIISQNNANARNTATNQTGLTRQEIADKAATERARENSNASMDRAQYQEANRNQREKIKAGTSGNQNSVTARFVTGRIDRYIRDQMASPRRTEFAGMSRAEQEALARKELGYSNENGEATAKPPMNVLRK